MPRKAPMITKKTAARNLQLVESGETTRELDVLGRLKSGMGTKTGHMEECTYTHEDGTVETRERLVPHDEQRCRAFVKGKENPWRGNRCAKVKNKGAPVCKAHGGSLPNVKKAAQARLAMAALPAAERLVHMALVKKNVSDADRLKALLAILDRAGVGGKQTVEIELKPWQQVLRKVYDSIEGNDPDVIEAEEGVDYEVEDTPAAWEDEDDE